MTMTIKEFIEALNKKLKAQHITDDFELDYIDISYPEADLSDIKFNVDRKDKSLSIWN